MEAEGKLLPIPKEGSLYFLEMRTMEIISPLEGQMDKRMQMISLTELMSEQPVVADLFTYGMAGAEVTGRIVDVRAAPPTITVEYPVYDAGRRREQKREMRIGISGGYWDRWREELKVGQIIQATGWMTGRREMEGGKFW